MTAPFYSANLLPGMIADLYVDSTPLGKYQPRKYVEMNAANRSGYHMAAKSGNMWHWFNDHMTGPFVYRSTSTAHWKEHVQVSNEHDKALVFEAFTKVAVCDKGIAADMNYRQIETEQRQLTIDEVKFDSWSHRVYVGEGCSPENLRAYLREYPMPIARVSDAITADNQYYDAHVCRRQRNSMWKEMVDGLTFHVAFKDRVPDGAIEWCKENIKGEFKASRLPDSIGIGFEWDGPKALMRFADMADAAKFKLFFSE